MGGYPRDTHPTLGHAVESPGRREAGEDQRQEQGCPEKAPTGRQHVEYRRRPALRVDHRKRQHGEERGRATGRFEDVCRAEKDGIVPNGWGEPIRFSQGGGASPGPYP